MPALVTRGPVEIGTSFWIILQRWLLFLNPNPKFNLDFRSQNHTTVVPCVWFQDPCGYQNPRMLKSLTEKGVYVYNLYLHLGSAGSAYTSLNSSGFNGVLSTWQIQVLLFGNFWDFLIAKHFWSTVGYIHRCRNCGHRGPPVQDTEVWTIALVFFAASD